MQNLRFPILALTASLLCLSSNHMLKAALEYEVQVEALTINVIRNIEAANDPAIERMRSKAEKSAALQGIALSTGKASIIAVALFGSLSGLSALSEVIEQRWKRFNH